MTTTDTAVSDHDHHRDTSNLIVAAAADPTSGNLRTALVRLCCIGPAARQTAISAALAAGAYSNAEVFARAATLPGHLVNRAPDSVCTCGLCTLPEDSPLETTMTNKFSPHDEFVFNIFSTALEGGIGYWSICVSEYQWQEAERAGDISKMGVTVELTEPVGKADGFETAWTGEGKPPEYRINADVIRRGIERIVAAKGPYYDPNGARTQCEAVPYLCRSVQRTVLNANRDLGDGFDEDGEVDANIADQIVQVGLFGRVVFG